MKVCVHGLWHLGSVTAACLAAAGFDVTGLDDDAATVAGLSEGRPPMFEPGLEDLVKQGLSAGKLRFTADPQAVAGAQVIWVSFDTPVDEDDRADIAHVTDRIRSLFPHFGDGVVVLISSQLPVGTTRSLADAFALVANGRKVSFAYSPENLRLGRALEAFREPGRIIVGGAEGAARGILADLLRPYSTNILWVSLESAEMAKHALNAFLATSVSFINEIAALCETTGADAAEVEAALRSEPRIGPKAYLRPGAAFAGGTLARDVAFLQTLAGRSGLELPMIGGIIPSNRYHRGWPLRQLRARLGDFSGRRIAVLGLAYKPGTDATRRSVAIELCRDLLAAGARLAVFDPAVRRLPDEIGAAALAASAEAALAGAEAVAIMTEWPEFQSLSAAALVGGMARALVLDQNRFLAAALEGQPGIDYVTIGRPI